MLPRSTAPPSAEYPAGIIMITKIIIIIIINNSSSSSSDSSVISSISICGLVVNQYCMIVSRSGAATDADVIRWKE